MSEKPNRSEPSFNTILGITLKIGFSLVILAAMLFFGSAIFAGACRAMTR
jgi:hypothetical protein